jgi:hypothetical protein
LLSLTLIPLKMDPNWLLPELAMIGFGVGLFRSPNHRALFGAVPRDKMGQAGGYQHLPRQLGESIGETGVIAMFTAVVLTSASAVGIQPPAPVPTVVPTNVATAVPVASGIGGKPIVIQPYQPAAPALPQPAGVGVAGGVGAITTAPGTGTSALDTDTSDDNIVDVPDDSSDSSDNSDLSPAVTSLPAEVQFNGYKLMWAIAGLLALGGAALSWFGREQDEADEREAAPAPAAAKPPRGVAVGAGS